MVRMLKFRVRMTDVSQLEKVYDRLFAWCEEREFAGPDPFDGLNSRIFQATPLWLIGVALFILLSVFCVICLALNYTILIRPTKLGEIGVGPRSKEVTA